MALELAADAVVLDIEGTTTPIAFVHTTLFGYVRAHLSEFLARRSHDREVAAALALLTDEHAAERDAARPPATDEAWIRWLMDRDRKSTGLKQLQGLMWREGYRSGELRAEVYADVAPALQRWHEVGLSVAIYSSGSVEAQRLLFAHTEAGDLTPWIDRYFDTTTGAKRDLASYQRIAAELGVAPARVVFLSDVDEELDAARGAGLQAVRTMRPGNAAACFAPSVSAFNQLLLAR